MDLFDDHNEWFFGSFTEEISYAQQYGGNQVRFMATQWLLVLTHPLAAK